MLPKHVTWTLEDIPVGHVGKFMLILSHQTLSTERMHISRIGYTTHLVPSREEILDDYEKKLCRVVHHKNTNKNSVLVHKRGT